MPFPDRRFDQRDRRGRWWVAGGTGSFYQKLLSAMQVWTKMAGPEARSPPRCGGRAACGFLSVENKSRLALPHDIRSGLRPERA
jgi:hypothetical protein